MDGAFDRGELARLEAADRANQYLYQVMDIGQAMLQSGGEVSRVEDSIPPPVHGLRAPSGRTCSASPPISRSPCTARASGPSPRPAG